jgi:hypothetical protein
MDYVTYFLEVSAVTVKSRRFRQYCLIPGPGFIVPVFLRYHTDDLAADRQIHAVCLIGVESRSRNNAGNGDNAVISLMPESQKLSVRCICQGDHLKADTPRRGS